MATSKLNIFNSLPQHASDSEEETNTKNAKNKVRHEKQEQRRHDNEKGHGHGHPAPRDPAQKEDISRQKQQHKTKGVAAEPHPQDRHSGHGNQAYGGKPKKSGAGKGNWGNYKEDPARVEGEGEEVEEGEPVEEKPEGKTLSEYFATQRLAQGNQQVNEAKSKITSEQLMKEVGKATLLKTKNQQEIDDKKIGKKKDKLNVDHHAGLNSEHADLLNFRTGFVEREYKERSRDQDGAQPRKFGGGYKGGRRDEEKPAEGQAEVQPQGEGAPAGEGQPAEATTPAEGQAQGQSQAQGQEQQGQGEGQKRREGGGGRGGRGNYRGDRPHGGERRNYGGPKGNATKVNVEDESAFPKLG